MEVLNKLGHQIDNDLIKEKLFNDEKTTKNVRYRENQEFVKYVVSVATHPIGLRASVSPFNCSQEQILGYIMDMFALTEKKIKLILFGQTGSGPGEASDEISDFRTITKSKKRHSWRPELRVRLNAPVFFFKDKLYRDNLSVRVYLFKEDKNMTSKTPQTPLESEAVSESRARRVLGSIFRKHICDTSALIRPVNEMRYLIKFEQTNRSTKSSKARAEYSMMVQSSCLSDAQVKVR